MAGLELFVLRLFLQALAAGVTACFCCVGVEGSVGYATESGEDENIKDRIMIALTVLDLKVSIFSAS